jgi:hypothetical protein
MFNKETYQKQGRREGVKGVTVSRGPDMKKGPKNHENKRKIEEEKFSTPLIKRTHVPNSIK